MLKNNQSNIEFLQKIKKEFQEYQNQSLQKQILLPEKGLIDRQELISWKIKLPKNNQNITQKYKVINIDYNQGEIILKIDLLIKNQLQDSILVTINNFIPENDLYNLEIAKLKANIAKNDFVNLELTLPRKAFPLMIGPILEENLLALGISLPNKIKDVNRKFEVLKNDSNIGKSLIKAYFYVNDQIIDEQIFTINNFYNKEELESKNQVDQLLITLENKFINFDARAKTNEESLLLGPIKSNDLNKILINNLPIIPNGITAAYNIIANHPHLGENICQITLTSFDQKQKIFSILINNFKKIIIENTEENQKIVDQEQIRVNQFISSNSKIDLENNVLKEKATGFLTPEIIDLFGLNIYLKPKFTYFYFVRNFGYEIYVEYKGLISNIRKINHPFWPKPSEITQKNIKNKYINMIITEWNLTNLIDDKVVLNTLTSLQFPPSLLNEIQQIILDNKHETITTINKVSFQLIPQIYQAQINNLINQIKQILRTYLQNKLLNQIQANIFLNKNLLMTSKWDSFIEEKEKLIFEIKAAKLNKLILEKNNFLNSYANIFKIALENKAFHYKDIPNGLKIPPQITELKENYFFRTKIPNNFINWEKIIKIEKNTFEYCVLKKGFVMNEKLNFNTNALNTTIDLNMKWSGQNNFEINDNYWPSAGEVVVDFWK